MLWGLYHQRYLKKTTTSSRAKKCSVLIEAKKYEYMS